MPSIINGLFAGRAGISTHGTAIAVVGDNISNASTIGYKTSRAEFEDFIAGGQAAGKVIGSGSNLAAVTTVFTQGTLEFTGRNLDLAIDGNGFFVVSDGGQRFYTRAGNFKLDSAGFLIDPNGFRVLGFPTGGSGALEELNFATASQGNVSTTEVSIAGNLDASEEIIDLSAFDTANPVSAAGTATSTTTYATLADAAAYSTVVDVFDSLGAKHTVTAFFFHSDDGEYTVRTYVNSEDVDPTGTATGIPRQIGSFTMEFGQDGIRTTPAGDPDFTATVPWNNGSSPTGDIAFNFSPFTQYSASSTIQSINQNGQGIGAVTSINVEQDGRIFALLDNGQRAEIGTVGMVNFSSPEGLTRVGKNLLQQSSASGEPIIGTPAAGTFGAVKAGSLELSTVDIAAEFVKLITLQRGFQANSRIITTINQLLSEIIQLT